MSPLEAAIRAACRAMGVDPDQGGGWRNFADVGRSAADAYRTAFIASMPGPLRWAVRLWLSTLSKENTP